MNIHDQDTFYRGKKEGLQEGIQQGLQQGLQQGAQEKALETARMFLSENIPIEQVARCTGLPLETVEELAKKLL